MLDPLLGRVVSRLAFGKSLITFASLWLVASFFGFLAIESVGAIEWVTNAAARLRLPSGAVAEFNPSRRTFFQYAAILAGSAPFLAATYGFAAGRLRYSIERVDVRTDDLERSLDEDRPVAALARTIHIPRDRHASTGIVRIAA